MKAPSPFIQDLERSLIDLTLSGRLKWRDGPKGATPDSDEEWQAVLPASCGLSIFVLRGSGADRIVLKTDGGSWQLPTQGDLLTTLLGKCDVAGELGRKALEVLTSLGDDNLRYLYPCTLKKVGTGDVPQEVAEELNNLFSDMGGDVQSVVRDLF